DGFPRLTRLECDWTGCTREAAQHKEQVHSHPFFAELLGFWLTLINGATSEASAEAGAMAWLGRISYSFYLWQGPTLLPMKRAHLAGGKRCRRDASNRVVDDSADRRTL